MRQAPQEGHGDRYCELGGLPAGRRASVLEFCLVFCTVSGLAQSSLWSLDFALDSLSYLARLGAAVDQGRGGQTAGASLQPRRRPGASDCGEARGLAPSPLGKCILCLFRAGRKAGWGGAQGPCAWP